MRLQRAEMLLGADTMQRLAATRVILFGVGGVGSWCADALVRSGVGHLTIVDRDVVSASNVNRQLMATSLTIGQPKVEAMREHLLAVNPDADIVARQEVYSAATADSFVLDEYDYVVDAIDSVPDKVLLILRASRSSACLVSSMGAALKLDPMQVSVAEFWKVKGCPLARALRNHFKRVGEFPARKFRCVYSPELVPNAEEKNAQDPGNGSLVHITGIFGFTLAGIILGDLKRL